MSRCQYSLFLTQGTQEPSEGLVVKAEWTLGSLKEAKELGSRWFHSGAWRFAGIVSDTGRTWDMDDWGHWQ